MPAALSARRNDAPAPGGAAAGEAAGSIIARLAVFLSDNDDEGFRLVGEWAEGGAVGDLMAFLAGTENRGEWLAGARTRRNKALRQAKTLRYSGRRDAARLLTKRYARYRSGGWQVDRKSKANPHPEGTFVFWLCEALRAVDRLLSQKQMRRILSDNAPADVR
jgi:hypothetical protein